MIRSLLPIVAALTLFATSISAEPVNNSKQVTSTASINLAGDTSKAKAVWTTFENWLAAYAKGDSKLVMAIFDKDITFSFQGFKDQRYSDMEASYVDDFKNRKPGSEWVPIVEEVYADNRMAIVRAVWELKVKASDGTIGTKARNRSMDVLRLSDDGEWRIFRSINYPEKN
jgi:ketosteroid isomerase-like protein